MRNSFADKIRKTVEKLDTDHTGITARAIFDDLGISLSETKSRAYSTLRDLTRSGEVERIGRGIYRWRGKKKGKPEIRKIMWRILRARRNITVEDLMELAGASEAYAREWLQMLDRREIVKHMGRGRYRLINDTVTMPDDREKALKLRMIRQRKKEILIVMNDIQNTVMEAKSRIESCLKSWEE